MSGKRRGDSGSDERFDSFIYDDLADGDEVTPAYRYPDSFYPDEHLRRPRRKTPDAPEGETESAAGDGAPAGDAPDAPAAEGTEAGGEAAEEALEGLLVDEEHPEPWAEEAPAPETGRDKKKRKRRHRIRRIKSEASEEERSTGLTGRSRRLMSVLITLLLTLVLAFMFFYRIQGTAFLQVPENLISRVVTPAQSLFSSAAGFVNDLFQRMKMRSRLEEEYLRVVAENEELVYKAMMADEYQQQLRQYEDMADEIRENSNLNPLACRVIGKDDGNYFSTFTINRGSRDGLEDYMAVTISGALIGFTENVKETSATVRTIIDSKASIAALIQSSRDQGIVSGTLGLGIDGKPMCRMYYLSDDDLPRPGDLVVTSGVSMSFPKGIPIGTVRESTRNMDQNKQYIVVEPQADFQHIEFVVVLRYKPQAESVSGRVNASQIEFVQIPTARPYPTLRIGSLSIFGTPTPDPNATPTPTPSPTPTPRPTPTPTMTPVVTQTPSVPIYEYRVPPTGPTATPSPTPSPTPTPYVTLRPEDMTYEED